MIMLLNIVKKDEKIIGYTYFDLDRYVVSKCNKTDLRQKSIWGEKDTDKLYGFKDLPIIDIGVDEKKPIQYKIIVVGRIEIDKNKYLYLVSYGNSILRIQNEKCFFDMKGYYRLQNVNMDETFQFIRSNKASIPDINVLLLRKKVQEGKLSVIVDSKDELNNFFKILEKGYRAEVNEDLKRKEELKGSKPKLFLSDRSKISKQFYKENKKFVKGCLDGKLSKDEFINNGYSFVERKRLMSDVQYDLDMTLDDIKKQVDNFVVVFCNDNDCKKTLAVLKEKFKNVTQLSPVLVNDMMNKNYNFMVSVLGRDKFKNEPCIYCVPMKNLNATFLVYGDKETGGFVSLTLPSSTYIPVNGVPEYNLNFLRKSQHEYVHYLSSSTEAVGFMRDDFTDKELEAVLRVFNEGITDIIAGYFVYNICKEKYSEGEYLKDSQGNNIPLIEIEKSISPYLKSLTLLKPIDSINETEINKTIFPIYTIKLGYKYNNLFVFYIAHRLGFKNILDLYMSNDYEGFIRLCKNKLKDVWDDVYNLLKRKNISDLEYQEYDMLLKALEG